jgi:glucokinase
MSAAFGIDLGGTNARVALVSATGKVEQLEKVKLTDRAPEAVADLLAQGVATIRKAKGLGALPVGVGMAAQMLRGTGRVAVAPNLGWRDVPFADLLEKRLGVEPVLMNDLGAAAWGEACAGAARGERDVILLFVGSGVGSALILDGRLYTGGNGVAGEVGHMKVVPRGRRCGCGELGCLEAYVSGKNIEARIRERLEGGAQSRLTKGAGAWDLEQAAQQGDGLAQELWEEVAELLAVSLGNLCTAFNPRRLILGGGVLLGCSGLREKVKTGLFDYALQVSQVGLQVMDAQLADDAGVIGSALHALSPDGLSVSVNA